MSLPDGGTDTSTDVATCTDRAQRPIYTNFVNLYANLYQSIPILPTNFTNLANLYLTIQTYLHFSTEKNFFLQPKKL